MLRFQLRAVVESEALDEVTRLGRLAGNSFDVSTEGIRIIRGEESYRKRISDSSDATRSGSQMQISNRRNGE